MAMPPDAHTRPPWVRSAGFTLLIMGFVAAASTGCADMLGLDGLSFDQSAERQDTTTPSSGTGGAGGEPTLVTPATGGTGGKAPTQQELWGFPARWSNAVIVPAQLPPSSEPRSAAEEATSSFHVYEPETGQLTSRRLREDGYDDVVSNWSPDFTIVMPRPTTEGLGIFGYEPELARNELAAPWDPWLEDDASSRSIDAEVRYGNPGWTHVLTLRHAETWRLLVHNQHTGRYRVGPAVADAPEGDDITAIAAEWEPGWSTLLAVDLGGGEHGLLKASLGAGAVQLDAFTDDGSLETVAEASWHEQEWFTMSDKPWTHALTFMADGEPGLLLYSSGSGRTLRGTLDEELTFVVEEDAVWAENWTTLTLVEMDGQNHALAYDVSRSFAWLLALDPLTASDPVVVR